MQQPDNFWFRLVGVLGFVVLLALVRMFEDELFYDPLLEYFKTSYTQRSLPKMDHLQLSSSLLARYWLNTFLSISIIYLLFQNRDLTKFALALYLLFFILLMIAFFGVLYYSPDNKMALFYIRRFLIQPLFLLLFIPAFYFQERASAKNNIS
jgi:exosortase F-associated protein